MMSVAKNIQTIVNDLIPKNLVETIDNPEHRRSVLIRVTRSGQKLFASLEARESQTIMALSKQLQQQDLLGAAETLMAIEALLSPPSQRQTRSLRKPTSKN